MLDAWPVTRHAAGVVIQRGGETRVHRARSGDAAARFPWASVTKLATALCVLVAVEEGIVALEAPAGPPGSTVRHLLAHASGLGPDGAVLAEPGRRRIYSNEGFRELGRVVAGRSGLAYSEYLSEAVLEPLQMRGTEMAAGGADPAAGLVGPIDDLVALGRELLLPTVVHRETLAAATTVAFPGLAGVLPGFGRQDPCDWGLGFELRDAKHPHWTGTRNSPETFGHFGQAGGFLWVDPVAGVACAVLTGRDFGSWAAEAWPLLSDGVLAEASSGRPAE
jgi:CubicO group peptidase (beta-lactamase class C family)